MGELDPKILEEAFSNALKSALGGAGPSGVNPRTTFHNKFQREMEEHDQDLEKKYDEDLNTTLIFAGLFSAVTSAFIIDIQSELGPDYEQMNNVLLEMLFNATTRTLPAGSPASIPRWSGPDPVTVQVQCVFYATLSATLLAAFLAMLGKQWLTQYKRNETRGSIADRSWVRERKLTGLRAWRFHTVMESLPLILQFGLVLFGCTLSRYLWEVNRSVSFVVVGFICFVSLFYAFIVTASLFSSDCPFQTPFSLLIHFAIALVATRRKEPQETLGPTQYPPQPEPQPEPSSPTHTTSQEHEQEANIMIQFPTPLFIQHGDLEGDRLDARCIDLLFEMSTGSDVAISIMDFIPEITWHSGIKSVPVKRIYNILIGCFNFSGPHPVVIPKSRDLAYLSAKAFVHIALQRRCMTQREEHERDCWNILCAGHSPLSSGEYGCDSDLATVVFMVDTMLGCDNRLTWKGSSITSPHRAWMSHMFLYLTWCEGQVSQAAMDFVVNSASMRPPSGGAVVADCFFIIGLMIGIPLHVSDLTVGDKSRERNSALTKIFGTIAEIFSSQSSQVPLALCALRLVTRFSGFDVVEGSYGLFKTIMASDTLTSKLWEAARYTAFATFGTGGLVAGVGPREILRFLDYHLGLQGAGKYHESDINCVLKTLSRRIRNIDDLDPLESSCLRDFNWTSPPFVRGVRSMMQPRTLIPFRKNTVSLVASISDKWFNCSMPIMEPEEMTEFCKHLAICMEDAGHGTDVESDGAMILFEMLRSSEWRKHIATEFWSVLAYSTLVEELESVKWCLQNATKLWEFARGLDDGEGLKWWYGTLWLYYDKLNTEVQEEVKKAAADMLRSDRSSDLSLYLSLIEGEISRLQEDMNELPVEERREDYGTKLRARLITMEGNHRQLARIVGDPQ